VNPDFSRQSFLGQDSDSTLAGITVGIIGLCGGGSHVGQQLAHLGVGGFVLCDPDIVESSNLNRMVGAGAEDARLARPKVDVIADGILHVNPSAAVRRCVGPWQGFAQELRAVDVVFGCVDSFVERSQLEAMCRRFLMPYIDVGMDVTEGKAGFVISGQVVCSLPGHACMRCFGFLTEVLLAEEAGRYGAAGGKPQVVWPNGVLASTAVGLFLSLIVPWHAQANAAPLYVEYDGNAHRLFASNRLGIVSSAPCLHFDGPDDLGDPFFRRLALPQQ
jgi:hypothetical protein